MSEQFLLPLGRRLVIFVGGFCEKLDSKDLIGALRGQTQTFQGIEDITSIGRPSDKSDKGKITFTHSDDMWDFLKGMKGKKLMYKDKALFHTIDKSRDEQTISRKVYGIVKAIKEVAMEPLGLDDATWWKTIQHNDVNGMAWIKLDVDGETKMSRS